MKTVHAGRMRWACFLIYAVQTACIAPTIDPGWVDAAAKRHHETHDSPQMAASLLRGFDSRAETALGSGDRALFHITLRRGGHSDREWLVRLTVDQAVTRSADGKRWLHTAAMTQDEDGTDRPFILHYGFQSDDGVRELSSSESTVTALIVDVLADESQLLGSSKVYVGSKFLRDGFVTACESSAEEEPKIKRQQRMAHTALLAFLSIVKRDPVLRDIFWQVVRMPTLWSIITNLGVKIRLAPMFSDAVGTETDIGGEDVNGWILPVQVQGNGQPVLLFSLQFVEPLSPLSICAGITSLIAQKPGDPTTSVTMRILAARRGPTDGETAGLSLEFTPEDPLSQDTQRAYPETSDRGNARIFYWGGDRSAGQLSIDYGSPPWKREYDAALDSEKYNDRRWRFGQNTWTSLDTNIELQFGDTKIAIGHYYLTFEKTSDNDFLMTFLDPTKIRARKLDAYHAQKTEGGTTIPLSYERVDDVAIKLTIKLTVSGNNDDKGQLVIAFGPHRMRAPFTMLTGESKKK